MRSKCRDASVKVSRSPRSRGGRVVLRNVCSECGKKVSYR